SRAGLPHRARCGLEWRVAPGDRRSGPGRGEPDGTLPPKEDRALAAGKSRRASAHPAGEGVSGRGLADAAVRALRERARREVDEGLLPSCQLAVALEGEVVESFACGELPAGEATRYVIFSATKAIVAAAIWQLLGEGRLALDDPVAKHVGEFATHGKDGVTVE